MVATRGGFGRPFSHCDTLRSMRWFGWGRRRHDLEDRLGYRFADESLLWTALTHRSHSHEQEQPSVNYERLEFLGDALLGFLCSDWLFRADSDAPEGVLTRRRQSVVQTNTLAQVARELGLGDAFRLGRGEERTGGREKPSLLADTFEAVLGAIYLDGGLRPAREFVERHLADALAQAGETREAVDDFKTRLQERIQASLRRTPRYRIVKTTGPPHALHFDVEVLAGGEVLAHGSGSNRKRAEQDAARRALALLEEGSE